MNIKKTNPYLETLLLLAFIIAAGFLIHPGDPFWAHFPASPYWLAVLLIPLRYGSPAGLFAGGLCAALQIAAFCEFSLSNLQEQIFLQPDSLLLPAAFLLTTHFVGEAVHSARMRNAHIQQELKKAHSEKEALENEFSTLEQAYRQVEGQVAGESDSLYALLRSLPALDTAEPYHLPKVIATLLQRFIKAGRFAYWQKSGREWRQIYPLGAQEPLPELGRIALEESRVVTAREHPEEAAGSPYEIAGTFSLGESAHVLAAGEIQFVFWHNRLERVFSAVLREVRLTQSRLEQQEALDRKLPFEKGLKLAGESFLKEHVQSAVLLQQRSGAVSSLLLVGIQPPDQHDQRLLTILASALRCLLRTSDTKAYLRESGAFAVFLPNTNATGGQMAAEKLRQTIDGLALRCGERPAVFRFDLREIRTTADLQQIMQELEEGRAS